MMKNKESRNSNSHSSLSSQVSIDTEELKKGMASILPLGDFDIKEVTTDFTTYPHAIPPDLEDQPLLKSDQAALMCLHEQLGYCCFTQLKQIVEHGIIRKKFGKYHLPNVQVAFMERCTENHGILATWTPGSSQAPYQALW